MLVGWLKKNVSVPAPNNNAHIRAFKLNIDEKKEMHGVPYVVECLLPENIIHMEHENRDQILTWQYFLIHPCHLFSSHNNFTLFVILIFKFATPVKTSLFPPVCMAGDIIILWVGSQVSNSCH